jgi:hypothetical protein
MTQRIGVAAFLAALWPAAAGAFPGSVRWGYANCRSCHHNVAGGGVLTPYGRQLSRELLSTWGSETEAQFGYGGLKTPAWLSLGGDVSLIETAHSATSAAPVHLLGADFEAAVVRGRFQAVGSVGHDPGDPGDPVGAQDTGFISRRHYLEYALSPTLFVRAGRFLPNYGIWNGDLRIATRAGVGWDTNATSYNLEINRVAEHLSAGVTAIGGRLDGDAGERERGGAATASLFFGGKRKVGLSVLATHARAQDRQAAGVHGVFGSGRHAYLLTETDVQRRDVAGTGVTWEVFSNWCLARETVKGLYVLLIDEISRRPRVPPERLSHSYGAALRWFPRPHVELQLRWRHQDENAVSPAELDGVTAFVHLYP